MKKITKEQQRALKRVFDRDPQPSYLAFRRTVQYAFYDDCLIIIPFNGMWLGIEKDGYTHS